MHLRLITPPDSHALTDMAKDYLRVDDDDVLVTALVTAALEYVSNYTGRSIGVQTWEATSSPPSGLSFFELPLPPLLSVDEVRYTVAGTEYEWPAEEYEVIANGIRPAYGRAYPQCDSMTVQFTCGYETLPESLKFAALLIVGDLFENREGQSQVQLYTNTAVENLLRPFRVFR